ncbi:MAG: glycosyltransferase [Bacteroidota bacterium]
MSSLRALVIYRVNRGVVGNQGIIQKMRGQVNGLAEQGFDVDFIIHDNRHVYLTGQPIFSIQRQSWLARLKWEYFDHLHDLLDYDFYLIRYGLSTPSMLRWLKALRKVNSSAKVILDMPTYPYQREWSGLKGMLALFIDGQLRSALQRYVDLVLHSGQEKSIYGIDTYHMTNGVTPSDLKFPTPPVEGGQVQLLAIGKWQYWHGLDRIIKSFAAIRPLAHLHIVGDGPYSKTLRRMISTLGLSNYVSWHGPMVGEALQKLTARCHIGIGTLGLHRKGVQVDSSLKHRYYCAHGLPMILSSPDPDFGTDLAWVHYVPIDDGEIDLAFLPSFAEDHVSSERRGEIQAYARERLSWAHKFKQLLDSLEAS